MRKIIFAFQWIRLLMPLFFKRRHTIKKPCVYIDLSSNPYDRYLYLFVKYFQMEGYTVVFKLNFRLLLEMYKDTYAKLLLIESAIYCSVKRMDCDFTFSDLNQGIQIAAYPSENTGSAIGQGTYVLPMTMHPNRYHLNIWEEIHLPEQRYCAVVTAGNFSKEYANDINEKKFKVYNRIELREVLKNENNYINPKSYEDYLKIEHLDKKILFINTQDFYFKLSEFRQELSKFDFFLSIPGIVIPLAHNIIEAMSVGCIPILQKEYAVLFFPPLEDAFNCITFRDKKDLSKVISRSLNLPQEEKERLRKNVLRYYHDFLTPSAVIQQIISQRPSKILIPTEQNGMKSLMAKG